jgi:hypothetical protein
MKMGWTYRIAVVSWLLLACLPNRCWLSRGPGGRSCNHRGCDAYPATLLGDVYVEGLWLPRG